MRVLAWVTAAALVIPGAARGQAKPPPPRDKAAPEKAPAAAAATASFPFALPVGFRREDLRKLKGAGFPQCERIMENLAEACRTEGSYWQLELGRFATREVELRFYQGQLYNVVVHKREILECADAFGALHDAVKALRQKYPGAQPLAGRNFEARECGDLDREDANYWQIAVGDMRIKVDARRFEDVFEVSIDYKHKKLAEPLDLAHEKAKSDKQNKGLQKL